MPDSLEKLVRYSSWASKKLLTFALAVPGEVCTREIPNSHGGILKTFQHIYFADRVWLARLEGASQEFADPAGGPSLEDLNHAWWPLLDRFAAYAAACDPDEMFTFKRMTGDEYSLGRGQAIQHVVNHGTYHRGQVASMLRENGIVPPSTDLLYYQLGI